MMNKSNGEVNHGEIELVGLPRQKTQRQKPGSNITIKKDAQYASNNNINKEAAGIPKKILEIHN